MAQSSTNDTWINGGLAETAGWNENYLNNAGNRVIVLGDSLSGAAFSSNAYAPGSWFHQACVLSNGAMRMAYNAGIPGERTDQMLARLQRDVIDRNPNICFVLGGTNDIGQIVPYNVNFTIRYLEEIIRKLIGNNIVPVLATIPPSDSKPSEATQANLAIVNLAYKYRLQYVDFYSLLVDPTNGKYKAGYSGDGTHPNLPQYKAMGQLVVDTIVPKLGSQRMQLPSSELSSPDGNIITGCCFATDTDANGVGNGWSGTGSGVATFSTVADTDIVGKWQSINKTGAANSNALTLGPISQAAHGLSAGDTIAFTGRIKTTGMEAGSGTFLVQLRFDGVLSTIRPISNWTTDITNGVFYYETTVPSGTTTLTITIQISSGVGELKVGQIGLYNLSKLRI